MTSSRKPLQLDLSKPKLPLPESREDATRRMATDEDSWPTWPRLPLKRPGSPIPELALLVSGSVTEDGRVMVFHANLFQAITESTPVTNYPTVEAFLAAGWQVD